MHNADATEVLKHHGKSFYFARLFLEQETGVAAARLYRFCRLIDDIADDTTDKIQARAELEAIKQSLTANASTHPIVQDFLMLCIEYDINREYGNVLINGVLQDLAVVALGTYEELLNYAFQVAGVVGLMMAPILGSDRNGYAFAIDLGIGMQFSNIARDVLEDAHMNRRYLPGEWVTQLTPKQLITPTDTQAFEVAEAIRRLLQVAERFYASGIQGLYHLKPRNRKAIAVAAYLYRDIGRKLLRHQCDYRQGRTIVGVGRKSVLAAKALFDLKVGNIADQLPIHDPSLHVNLNMPFNPEFVSNASGD